MRLLTDYTKSDLGVCFLNKHYCQTSELQIRGGIEDNSEIISMPL